MTRIPEKPNQDTHRTETNKKKFKKGLIDALTKEEEKLQENPNLTKTRIQIEARIKREQKARVMGLAAWNIRRKSLKDPVLQAVASDPDGNQYECNSQDTMVPAMGTSISGHQQQCKQTPF
jgi:DNA topoisomerase VI subunit B